VTFRTRFAPSPTGPLHLGHAYSAMLGFDLAMAERGEWLLRIEDIDRQRSKPEWERQIYEDLEWLGLRWPEPVMRQSERLETYRQVLDQLWINGDVFECTCSRADVVAAASAPQEGTPLVGPDGIVYPGTCRGNTSLRGPRPFPEGALRMRMDRAERLGEERIGDDGVFHFRETGLGPNGEHGRVEFTARDLIHDIGDVVLARRGMGTSYHLSVVLDDAAQGITQVVRGQDLFEATKIHVVLQRLLGIPTPTYHHHRLIRDESGRRLAKREDAKAIRRYRHEGATPRDIRRLVGL
jgi:glutamyl-Q tRNA(Asp) synthetase